MSAMPESGDASGWLDGLRHQPSPNHDRRPEGERVRLIVVHSISLPPGEYGGDGIEQFFTNRLDVSFHPYYAEIAALRVSAHFLIRRDGAAIQFVSCSHRAWHAGTSCWRGHVRCNDFSIGIELEGTDASPFTEAQYLSLSQLARRLQKMFPIENIVGHADIAPLRKTDPGRYFDWRRFHFLLANHE